MGITAHITVKGHPVEAARLRAWAAQHVDQIDAPTVVDEFFVALLAAGASKVEFSLSARVTASGSPLPPPSQCSYRLAAATKQAGASSPGSPARAVSPPTSTDCGRCSGHGRPRARRPGDRKGLPLLPLVPRLRLRCAPRRRRRPRQWRPADQQVRLPAPPGKARPDTARGPAAVTDLKLPSALDLTRPQFDGWACVWCSIPLMGMEGVVSAGRAEGHDGRPRHGRRGLRLPCLHLGPYDPRRARPCAAWSAGWRSHIQREGRAIAVIRR
jgi:hypothetical protein